MDDPIKLNRHVVSGAPVKLKLKKTWEKIKQTVQLELQIPSTALYCPSVQGVLVFPRAATYSCVPCNFHVSYIYLSALQRQLF